MGPDVGHDVWWILFVAFLTTGSTNAQNTAVCGGELAQQSGVLTSPDYPDTYPNDKRCAWTVRARPNELVDLRFSRLDLEGTESNAEWFTDTCPDYVRVYDGGSTRSPLLAIMCRIKNQTELAKIIIRSTSNVLYIVFESDYQGQRPGFVASYWTHVCPEFTYGTETCNNTCTCNKQHTASCNNTNGECICKKGWTSKDCSQDLNECVNLKVEPCPFDYMECANNIGGYDCVCKAGLVKNTNGECEVQPDAVCDQGNGCSHLCVKISGQEQCYCPDNMKLVGNTCKACSNVTFGKDCRLSCNCIQKNTKSCDITTGGCICSEGWTASNCSQDIDECTELRNSVCPSSIEQCVNTIGGYECKCKSGAPRSPSGSCGGCSYTLTDSSGVIQSNGYPNYTSGDVLCNWTIIARDSGMTISFSMSEIYIGGYDTYRDNCYYGSVEVYDGSNSSDSLLGRYCGYYDPGNGIIRSSGNLMFIVFRTSSTSSHFNGTYSTSVYQVFRSITTNPAGVFTSPGFPVSLPYNVAYSWTITVSSGNVVNFSFSEFDLGECEKDFVDIYDGKHAGAPLIDQFCGTNRPRTVSSTNRSMHIIYSSVGSTSEKGFNGSYITDACWCSPYYTASCKSPTGPCVCKSGIKGSYCDRDINECLTNPCPAHSTCYNYHGSFTCTCWNGTQVNVNGSCDDWNKTLYGPSGDFQSQGFPNKYPSYINYTWSILGKAKEVITLGFSEFDLEPVNKCSRDSVEIYDGVGPNSKLLGKYCGKNIPALLRSTKPEMHIYFQTDDDYYPFTGFNGTYYLHECPVFMYGELKCTNPCSCAFDMTRVCDNINGVCFCKPGWVGRGCSQDLDECRNPTVCPKNSECVNEPGNFSCECNSGYVKDTTGQCRESSHCSAAMKNKCSHLCDLDNLTNKERCYCPQDFILLNDNVTCVVSLYPHGSAAADKSPFVRTNGEGTYVNNNIVFSSLVPFGKGFKNNARILYYGAITFNKKYMINIPDLEEAHANRYSLLAPFWTEKRVIGIGDIFYHVYETCGSSIFMDPGFRNTSSPKEQVVARAIRDIKQFYNLPDFKVSVVFVVTWKNVKTKGCDRSDTNTFQAILVSGYIPTTGQSYLQVEEKSYVIYIYNNGSGICKPEQPFEVGIVTESGIIALPLDKINPQLTQMIGNTGHKGVITFPVGKKHSESIMCQRYLCEHADLVASKHFQAEIDELYKCPCSLDKLGLQWQLLKNESDMQCYSISAVAKRRLLGTNQRNRVCCYSWTPPKSDSWEDWHESWIAGSFIPTGHLLVSDPWPVSPLLDSSSAYKDAEENMQARTWCCEKSPSEFCDRFYKVFGDLQCTPHPTFVPAIGLGDPLVTTFDGKDFFMNGWGEYVMVLVPSKRCVLQARTQKVEINGKLSNGTVFVVFASQEGDSDNVQVQLDTTGSSFVILANGNDFTSKFYRDPTFTWSTASVNVGRINQGSRILVAVTFKCGISFKVHVGVSSLEIDIEMDTSLRNLSIGLLGNYNGDTKDDFLLPNGTILPHNMTERQIFEKFVKEYLVTDNTSVFTYEKGESCVDYQHPEFVPLFFNELSPDKLLKAKTLCGDDDACVYDITVTGSEEFATNSREAKKVHEQSKRRLSNRAPKIALATDTDNRNRWRVKEGRTNIAVVKVKDADNDAVTIALLKNFRGVELDQNGTLTYFPDLKNPISLHIRAKDSIGSYSSILIIPIAVCPRCNNHGDCDTNATTAEFYEGQYQTLKCSCFPAYTGETCESELNACENSPCARGQGCTDKTAAEQGDSPEGYTCGPCPAGTTDMNGSCEDKDECTDPTICDQECIDTYRSYVCRCRPGFRLDPKDGRTCNDIDECVERTSACEQVCRNTPGSYECACRNGYTLRSDGTTCSIDANIVAMCQQCEQVCNVSNDQVPCDCNLGFEIDRSNPTRCSDIDECSNGVKSPCSQKCTNTRGRFMCSCHPGYKLDTDGVLCLECDSSHYGENCSSTCNCRGHGRCDRVLGCVCNDQWTGKNCDKDVNECGGSHACANGQVCLNEPGSYSCACPNGYRLENGDCQDIDECKEHTNRCDMNMEDCNNNKGNYTCLCKEGFKQNNATGICEDINECEQHNDGCDHLCENGQGSYRCVCHSGYRLALDRRSCEKYKQVCDLTCSHGCSLDEEGTAYCICPRGYNKVGADSCEDIDKCASLDSNPCGHKDRCKYTEGNYFCSCDPGYRLDNDARSCVACSSGTWGVECNMSCACGKEAISCDPVTGCQCKPGCSGVYCTEVNDRCASGNLTCQSNEECVISGCSSVCQCRKGYFWDGGQCQDENECLKSGLHNCNQICTNTQGGFVCSCFAGYNYNESSNTCVDVDECEKNPCKNTCVNTEGSYICSCPTGQVLQPDGVSCDCPNGCEIECKCVENNMAYCNKTNGKCLCKKGWTSEDCSVAVHECLRNSCPDNRKCRNLNGSSECVCWNEQKIGSDGTCKECNQTLTGKTGYIMSSNYPDFYPNNKYCAWTITVDSEAVIALSFIDYRVEGCPNDYVKIYNGVNRRAPLLAQVCDNWRTTFISKTNNLHLDFNTDFSDIDKGFLAFYTSHVPCKTKKCSHTCSRISSSPVIEKCQCPDWMKLSQSNDSNCININACNTIITEPVGSIVSPKYPDRYPASSNCRWTIQGGRNSFVKLSFYDFSLEYSNKCLYDSVKVYDGNSETAPLLGHFCGNNMPPAISSSGNSLLIVFKTDAAFNYLGFRARYTIYEK